MDLWLDSVMAMPLIGVAFEPNFVTSANIHQILGPFIESLDDKFGVDKIKPEPYQLFLQTGTGISVTVKSDSISVQQSRIVREKMHPGGDRRWEVDELEPYTPLLNTCQDITVDLLAALSEDSPLLISRIGVIAASELVMDALPPGVTSLVEYLSTPWGADRVELSNTTLLVNLGQDGEALDRCHHTIRFNLEQDPQRLEFNLDWQRIWPNQHIDGNQDLSGLLSGATTAAREYFQRVAEGNLEDV
ncbi:hypothetical protein KAI87_12905 [Myxococcota bacterium]|nr:hypothetical protein [Myxococcota bacterium]